MPFTTYRAYPNTYSQKIRFVTLTHFRFQEIVLGNPWLDPYSQNDVSEFAHIHEIVTTEQRYILQELNQLCQNSL